jgi:large subunit ribosomal protein L21
MSQNKEQIPSFEKYAIFQTGGKQYQAIEGKTIAIEKLDIAAGGKVEFKEVLLRKMSEGVIEIGQPYLASAVQAEIVKHLKGPKLTVFKFKRRKKLRVKKGHRQPITVIRVMSI